MMQEKRGNTTKSKNKKTRDRSEDKANIAGTRKISKRIIQKKEYGTVAGRWRVNRKLPKMRVLLIDQGLQCE
jgi:hypothetical protein